MEKLAAKIADHIARALEYDDEKRAVIAYGLAAMIQISVTILLVFLFALLSGVPVEAMIICLSVSVFRKYSGGAHAAAITLCTVYSVLYCVLTALAAKLLLFPVYHPVPMLIAILLIYSLSFFFVNKYAPVDSPNKPIKSEKKIRRMRRGSFVILSVYLFLSALFYALGYQLAVYSSYGISLLFGVAWQVFTLTPYGSKFIGLLNRFYNSLRREGLK